MSYSIFENTMADMNYRDVERLAEDGAVVLFPVAVIEEHGPHLPLGTDTYLTYAMLKHTKKLLDAGNVPSVIAPPFYWGINKATGGFAGSFTVKVDTMKAVMKDSIECLDNWGFKKVVIVNMHGDFLHSKTIIDICKEIHESDLEIRAYNIIPEFFGKRAGVTGEEPYMLVQRDERPMDAKPPRPPKFLDIHAGGFETSLMLEDFPKLVDLDLAKTLKSSETTFEGLKKWQQGGALAKEVTPDGYCGNPSNIDLDSARLFIKDFASSAANLIINEYK